MYKPNKPTSTSINRNTSYKGETLEEKIDRIVNNNEPITDGAPLIYTERKDGVQPEYDIRTDRFEVAIDAMDKVAAAQKAKREEFIKKLDEKNKDKNTIKGDGLDTGGEPIQATKN